MLNKGITIFGVILLISFLGGIFYVGSQPQFGAPNEFISRPSTTTDPINFAFTVGTSTAIGDFGTSTLMVYGSTTIQQWDSGIAFRILNAATSTIFDVNANTGTTTARGLIVVDSPSFQSLISCDTIDTNADGFLRCGTDAEGAGGGTGSNWTYVSDSNGDFIRPSTTVGVILSASSTISNLIASRATTTDFEATGLSYFNGGFISSASSTVNAVFNVQEHFSASSTASIFGLLTINYASSTSITADSIYGTGTGGSITVQATDGVSGGSGGALTVNAGDGQGIGGGGAISITSGDGGVSDTLGGSLTLLAGAGKGSGIGSGGGNLVIGAGNGVSGAPVGEFKIRNPASISNHAILSLANITSADRTFTFPDTTGTFCLTSTCLTAISGQTWELLSSEPNFLAPTTTAISIFVGTTTDQAQLKTNSLFNLFATSTDGTLIFASTTESQTGDIFKARDSLGADLFTIDASGGLIASASSTFIGVLNAQNHLSASSTASIASLLTLADGLIASASSTFIGVLNAQNHLSASSSVSFAGPLTVDDLTSALVLAASDGQFGEYAGIDCTNQFVRDVGADGAGTCAPVTSSDVDTSLIPSTRALTIAGTANQITSSAGTQNLTADRTWTLSIPTLFIIDQASTSLLSAGDRLFVGGTGTTTIRGDSATSSFSGGIETTGAVDIQSTSATSTFGNGLVISNGSAQFLQTLNCFGTSVLETDASGNLQCGVDNDSATFGQTWELLSSEPNFLAPTTTSLSVFIGTTTDQAQLKTNSLVTLYATSTDGTLLFASTTPGQTGNIFTARDSTSADLFSIDANGGLISSASSTFIGVVNAQGHFSASSTASFSGLATLEGGFLSNSSSTVLGDFTTVGNSTTTLLIEVLGSGTSTFTGGILTDILAVNSSSASSTFNNGLVISNGSLQLNQTVGCNTATKLATDASGNLFCDTDLNTGGAGFGQTWELLSSEPNFLAPTTTAISVFIGTTTNQAQLKTNSLFNIFATSTDGTLIFASTTDGQTGDILRFQDSTASPLLTVTASGNVGLASSTPWGRFSVEMDATSPAFVVSKQGSTTPAFWVNSADSGVGGNVGIGTSTPQTNFVVQGDTDAGIYGYVELGWDNDFSNNLLTITSNENLATGLSVTNTDTSNQQWSFGTLSDSATALAVGPSKGFFIKNVTADPAYEGVAQFVIDTTGRVGISTTTPGTPLSVTGNAVITGIVTSPQFNATNTTATSTFEGGLSVLNFAQTGTASSTFGNGLVISNGSLQLLQTLNCNGTSLLETDSSGNLQCGDDGGGGGDPNVILKVVGNTTYLAASTTANAWFFDSGFVSNSSSTINADLTVGSPSSGSFYWDGTNQRLGLGTSTPFAKLSIGANGAITTTEKLVGTSTAVTLDWTQGNQQNIGVNNEAVSITHSNFVEGQHMRIILCQGGSGTGTATWPNTNWTGGTAPTLTATLFKCDVLTFLATTASSTSQSATSTVVFGSSVLNF